MKKNITWAVLLGVIALSSCGLNAEKSKEVKEVSTQKEATVEVDEMKAAEVQLDEGTKELKASTEATKAELDQILNDL